MTDRRKVLMSAYGCEPGAGSEPGAGWEWCLAAAEHHDVWLLTRANNVPRIEAGLAGLPALGVHVVGFDLPRPFTRLKKRVPGGAHLYYVAWQYAVRRRARQLHTEVQFDVVHHVTWSTDWLPAGVAALPSVPFVWGPIGGATRTPWRHWRWFGLRGVLAEGVRAVAIGATRWTFARRLPRRAAHVLAQNGDERRLVGEDTPFALEPQIALRDCESRMVAPDSSVPPTAVFAGRLLYWKGIRPAIAALARTEARSWTLHVFGDGPDRRAAENLAARLGVADRVQFHGQVPRQQVLDAIRRADALLFPSFHDAGGWIVAEADAIGCKIVCLAIGGPAVLVPDDRGHRKVDVETDDLVGAIAHALADVADERADAGLLSRNERWYASRLPSLLDALYRSV